MAGCSCSPGGYGTSISLYVKELIGKNPYGLIFLRVWACTREMAGGGLFVCMSNRRTRVLGRIHLVYFGVGGFSLVDVFGVRIGCVVAVSERACAGVESALRLVL